MNSAIEKRYDFILIFDVKDGNPNGDPDAGNLPRVDPETGHGLVTDVCLKRKVRNYVGLVQDDAPGYGIYVREKAVLGRAHFEAFKDLGIDTGQDAREVIGEELLEDLDEVALPEAAYIETDDQGRKTLVLSASVDKDEIKKWIKETDLKKDVKKFFNKLLKEAKPKKPTAEETARGQARMCEKFFDIRTFGGVLSLSTAPNCGQVRGPVQFTFARSVDPVVPLEHSITRMAVATEAEAEKQGGDNRTMGRKFTIPYGLYVAHGFVSAPLAKKTLFSQEDLELLWNALKMMFEHDRSAARGEMATRKLVVFEHDSALGQAPAHTLFDRLSIERFNPGMPPRSFSDYQVLVNRENMPEGVTVLDMV